MTTLTYERETAAWTAAVLDYAGVEHRSIAHDADTALFQLVEILASQIGRNG